MGICLSFASLWLLCSAAKFCNFSLFATIVFKPRIAPQHGSQWVHFATGLASVLLALFFSALRVIGSVVISIFVGSDWFDSHQQAMLAAWRVRVSL